jgi:hypothetical protein
MITARISSGEHGERFLSFGPMRRATNFPDEMNVRCGDLFRMRSGPRLMALCKAQSVVPRWRPKEPAIGPDILTSLIR